MPANCFTEQRKIAQSRKDPKMEPPLGLSGIARDFLIDAKIGKRALIF